MADTAHTILGGKVHVYKRPNSRFWQCSTYLAGKNRRVSTKEDSLARAKEFAEDWYLQLRGKARAGEISGDKTFADAAAQFEREYEIITGGQRNPRYVDGHSIRLRLHLLPFFGKLPLSEVTAGKVQEYRLHRMTPGDGGDQTFRQAAAQFERDAAGAYRQKGKEDTHRAHLREQLIPYFGRLLLSEITPDRILAYRAHRIRPEHGGRPPAPRTVERELVTLGHVIRWAKRRSKPPARSTLHHEIVTLRQVLKTALRHGWVQHLPDLSAPYGASGKVTHRAWFSPEEYRKLYETTRKRARAAKGRSSKSKFAASAVSAGA